MEIDTTETVDERTLYAVAADALGGMVDVVVETERMAAMIAAMRADQIDQCRRFAEVTVPVTTSRGMTPWSQANTARRTLVSELACALRLPERTVETLVIESRMLVHELPATLETLRAGDISYRHVKSIIDHANSLPETQRAEFEAAVLTYAAKLSVSQFDRKARTVRERMDPATITERHTKSVADRELSIENARDGMAWLHHYLAATDAHAIYNRATEAATARAKGDDRTLEQRRSDFATELLLGGEIPGRAPSGIRPWIAVIVPVMSLLGHSDEPATLEGYGPIDIETARRLAGDATSFVRILTHPETGAVLSVGRDRYSVPADLKTWLRLRDGTCRKPGCSRTAVRCDIDHSHEWQHLGETAHNNLAHLCPKHHAEKHHTGWRLKHVGDGDIQWTSPSGRAYLSEPSMRMPVPSVQLPVPSMRMPVPSVQLPVPPVPLLVASPLLPVPSAYPASADADSFRI